jgi:hypothetical protein
MEKQQTMGAWLLLLLGVHVSALLSSRARSVLLLGWAARSLNT